MEDCFFPHHSSPGYSFNAQTSGSNFLPILANTCISNFYLHVYREVAQHCTKVNNSFISGYKKGGLVCNEKLEVSTEQH